MNSWREISGEHVRGQNKFDAAGKMIPFRCRKCDAAFWRKDDMARHYQSDCKTKGTADRNDDDRRPLVFKVPKGEQRQ